MNILATILDWQLFGLLFTKFGRIFFQSSGHPGADYAPRLMARHDIQLNDTQQLTFDHLTFNQMTQCHLDQLLFTIPILFTFICKTSYLNEEVDCTKPSPSVSVPWSRMQCQLLVTLGQTK
jgi:hypothetical protein